MALVWLCLPAYNEEDGLPQYLHELLLEFGERIRIVLVDDASVDATYHRARSIEERYPGQLHLIRNDINLGHGRSLLRGIRYVLNRAELGVDTVVTADGDGQVSAQELARLVKAWFSLRPSVLEAVRVRRDFQEEKHREIASFLSRLFVRILSRKSCMDANTPVRVYDAEALKEWFGLIGPCNLKIPNLAFSILARRGGNFATERVTWRRRLGTDSVGSTWARNRARRVMGFISFAVSSSMAVLPCLLSIEIRHYRRTGRC